MKPPPCLQARSFSYLEETTIRKSFLSFLLLCFQSRGCIARHARVLCGGCVLQTGRANSIGAHPLTRFQKLCGLDAFLRQCRCSDPTTRFFTHFGAFPIIFLLLLSNFVSKSLGTFVSRYNCARKVIILKFHEFKILDK